MTLGIDEGAHHLHYRGRIEDGKERDLRTERIPKTIERIKVRLVALPEWVLACVVLRVDHSPVDSTVEIGQNGGIDICS